MRLKIKILLARIRLFMQKTHNEAKKLALAVVILEFILAGGWLIAQNKGWLSFLEPKTVIIKVSEAKEPPKIKPQEPKTDRIDELADTIWFLESTRGKNNYSKCEQQGKINGIGYNVWGNNYSCFESHAEEMQVLRKWIVDHFNQNMTEKELLCHYSGNNYKICQEEYLQEERNINRK